MPREIRQREIQWDEPQKWLVGGGDNGYENFKNMELKCRGPVSAYLAPTFIVLGSIFSVG